MTYAELVTDTRFLAGGVSSNDYTAALVNVGLNAWYQKVVTMVLQAQDEFDFDDINHTDFPILTTSLVANQQDYSIPAAEKVLKVKRVEVTYNGTNWYKAEPIDVNERGLATDSTSVNNSFYTTKPYYDIQYNSIFLYPIPTANSTNGLKIWWSREIDEFTTGDTTQEPGLDEPFHRMLSIGAALDWEISRKPDGPRARKLQEMMADYEARLYRYYGHKQQDRNYTLKPAYRNDE
jgi:hypothetical protein